MAYEDLLKDTSESFENGNYFVVTVPDLTPGTIYPLEFRWKYKDGTFSDWGCVKTITAAPETSPKKPTLTATYFQGIITVSWNGKAFDAASYSVVDRVEIYLKNINIGNYFPAGSIQYNNGTGGSLSIPVEPGTYKLVGKAISKGSLESVYSDEITVTAKIDAPVDVTTVNASWSGSDFAITFNHDPSAAANKWLSYYLVTLTSGSDTKTFNLSPITGTTQKFAMSLASNRAAFGIPKTSFTGSVKTVDIYGNMGTAITFGSTVYVNSLTAPSISATEIQQGYSIDYTTPTSATYDHIEIEEIESSASTAPTTGYSVIFSGVANPAPIIRPNQNKRWVRARFADNIGSFSGYSNSIAVTPLSPVTADTVPPAAPASGSVTAGVDNSTGATVGFNAYLNISWSAVSDSTLKGYRIRFRENGTSNPYSYVDSPGTGTTFRLNGLSIGTVYEVAVASYDEYNNTSSTYTSVGTAQATGTPFIGKNVTTVGYFGASATGDTGTFKFGYGVQDSGGTKRGLNFNSNNYWYIDSAQSALFKLGGDTNNYIEWNGSTFVVQGDIRAKAGNFSGNVQIQSGGSLYSGTLSAGSLSGAGYILNNTGLTFNSSTVNGITTINGTTGKLTTASANIGGWDVTSSQITKTSSSGTITLNSSNAQITLGSTSYTAGIATPDTNSATDIVFWAGGSRGIGANFYVRADGTVKMSSATITGYATSADLGTKIGASDVANHIGGQNVTTITGNKVRTGTIEGNSYSYTGTYNPFSDSGTSIDLTSNIIRSPQFAIVGGNAYFKGQLSAATGSFNGSVTATTFNIAAGTGTSADFWKSDGSFQFGGTDGIKKSTTGAITIGTNVTISASVSATDLTTTNLTISSAGRIYNSGGFEVTTAGKLIATGAEIGGKVTADTGSIGGWTIGSNGVLQSGTTYLAGSYDDPNLTEDVAIYDILRGCMFKSVYVLSGGVTVSGGGNVGTSSGNFVTTSGNFITGTGSVDVGIGTTTLYSDGRIYANTLGVYTGASAYAVRQVYAGGTGTSTTGYLRVNTSSRKFKKNITPLTEGNYMDLLTRLSPVSYIDRNEDEGSPRAFGLIAEEVAEIPELKDGLVPRDAEGNPGAVHYELVGVLSLMALKEIKHKLDNIFERLDRLEG
jgi:hypothetical protein